MGCGSSSSTSNSAHRDASIRSAIRKLHETISNKYLSDTQAESRIRHQLEAIAGAANGTRLPSLMKEVQLVTHRVAKEYPRIARKLQYEIQTVLRLIDPVSNAKDVDDDRLVSTFHYQIDSSEDVHRRCQGVSFGDTAPSLLKNHNMWIHPDANNSRLNSLEIDEVAAPTRGLRGRHTRVHDVNSKQVSSRRSPAPQPRLKGLTISTDDLATLGGEGPDYGFYDLSEPMISPPLKAIAAL